MELKFLLSVVVSIIGSFLGSILFGNNEQAPTPKVKEQIKPLVVVEKKAAAHKLEVPSFVTSIPSGNFSGVSSPCSSLAEARKSAVGDVVRQILGSIKASYDHRYVNSISGNPRKPKFVLNDSLQSVARGIVLDVERRVVQSTWSRDNAGKYISFILVSYPDELIDKMRRLSKGAKVTAVVVSNFGKTVRLKVSEVNGVSVILSSVDLHLKKNNRFAKVISFFIWKVPKGSEYNTTLAIDPVKICGRSCEIGFSLPGCGKNISDYLLGAQFQYKLTLEGYDEIGRKVRAKVVF
ncbi:hypothetical protein ACFL6B_03735 [Thermodesulfobacteriota bacterium]